jgi:hypothetical protein
MKIHGVRSGQQIPRGEQMAKKKVKSTPEKKDSIELSPEARTQQQLERTATSTRSRANATAQPAEAPLSKPADTYQKGRPGAEVPLRSDKIEHARMMIKNNGYDAPQVVAAIVDRLVFALKE